MRKKILIVVPSFSIGGTIVSLDSLLSVIDTEKYEINIFPLNRKGVYLNKLPNCTILPENIWLSSSFYGTNIFCRFFVKILRIVRVVLSKIGINIIPFLAHIGCKQIKTMDYDTVISYVESINPIVAHYTAKKKIAWVHCEYERYKKLVGKDESKAYELYDTVVCVSEFAKSQFCKCLPQMATKTVAIHNVINTQKIRRKAQEPIDDVRFLTNNFTIVSAGRFDPVKQFHLIPQIAAEIKKRTQKKFVWYIIGGYRGFDGYIESIKDDISRLGVNENVVLLDEKSNIYPYMSEADLYVSTSLSESYPLVINEAKALGITVIANNFGSASESVNDGVDGFIVSIENNQMADKIADIINTPDRILTIREYLCSIEYDYRKTLAKVNMIL